MEPIPDYGELMTREEFEKACRTKFFIDYDGHGHYATETEMSDILAFPSKTPNSNVGPEFTHVVWFNK